MPEFSVKPGLHCATCPHTAAGGSSTSLCLLHVSGCSSIRRSKCSQRGSCNRPLSPSDESNTNADWRKRFVHTISLPTLLSCSSPSLPCTRRSFPCYNIWHPKLKADKEIPKRNIYLMQMSESYLSMPLSKTPLSCVHHTVL